MFLSVCDDGFAAFFDCRLVKPGGWFGWVKGRLCRNAGASVFEMGAPAKCRLLIQGKNEFWPIREPLSLSLLASNT